ncbi:T9SS type A sorting domain-containing protein [Pedobacter nanyangensis]|uniref:T9SS type A sorting domain-containing protein n=1 Tax=Pedobacter nanyangensis TaxID=1562389 RepID=UPI000DE3CD9E|nr:T9SS type A sorting domain-containing protein [Pedobacter nanyangensis]
MRISFLITIAIICACVTTQAQIINYVKNPSFEDTIRCPDEINQISYSKFWTCAIDTVGEPYYAPEYYNTCSGTSYPIRCGIPENSGGYQFPRTGNAYLGGTIYYDKTLPAPPGLHFNWRDYFQGRLYKNLTAGQTYCVSFWVVMGEVSAYGQNKIGAYLDDGSINFRDTAGIEITDVIPQVFSTEIIKDTFNWTKVEGSFVASGNETHITLGCFAKNEDVDTFYNIWGGFLQYSYYYFDDVSVIPIDYMANAGFDVHVPEGGTVEIGNPDTTAFGLDCKWYHKGMLIDSGVRITVPANILVGVTDTYVVVQTICGNITRDTVTVYTAALGVKHWEKKAVQVYPNPSTGRFSISADIAGDVSLRVYDLQGRLVHRQEADLGKGSAELSLHVAAGTYLLHLEDREGKVYRERLQVE